MVENRIIPCLLLDNNSLVKTVKFSNPKYIGDVINTVRMFNELEVDELMILGINNSKNGIKPNMDLLQEIASECFMPLSYGGGIEELKEAKKIISLGFEKVVINSAAYSNLDLIKQISKEIGNQSLVGSIDLKKNLFGKYKCYSHSGTVKKKIDPLLWSKHLVDSGVGELLITNINHEGTWSGFDCDILDQIRSKNNVPIIAHGGAGKINHISKVFKLGINAAAVGSIVVYQKKNMGVLINSRNIKIKQ